MDLTQKLSPHFALSEFLRSQVASRLGIDMTPDQDVVDSLRELCINVLEPLRSELARPIVISSGYRPPRLNKAIGGASHSQHMVGEAADLIVPGMTVRAVWDYVRKSDLPFDQVIEEFDGWTHVSYRAPCRGEVLVATRDDSGVHYTRAGRND